MDPSDFLIEFVSCVPKDLCVKKINIFLFFAATISLNSKSAQHHPRCAAPRLNLCEPRLGLVSFRKPKSKAESL